MLQGMTDKKAEALVPLAKSWLQAPEMKINSGPYKGGSCDQSERVYMIEKTDIHYLSPCSFSLEASENVLLINPAIIIKNWRSQWPALSVNNQNNEESETFRPGIRKGLFEDDLILWIKMNTTKPVKIILKREDKKASRN